MKVSYNLLKKYIDLEQIDLQHFCDLLSVSGFEVEEVLPCAQATKLVVGKVIECKLHPNSDHLHVCKVDIKDEILQIVCGAPNVAVQQKVIVCQVGCKLNALGIEIKEGVIRDVPSFGMLASLKELGVDEKNLTEEQKNGIEILPDDFPIGATNVLELLNLDDAVIDISLTPNRSDVLALNSLIREVAAILNRPYHLDAYADVRNGKNEFTADSTTTACDYFSVTHIQDVTIKKSPQWMIDILHRHDIKSINNIVDIANYTTLMTGQPLHMYDADKLGSKQFVVKEDGNTKVTALDGKEYQVINGDIVVTNQEKVECIAGILGSASSIVDEFTKNIVLEAALFNGAKIQNSAKRLNLATVAATNYAKKAMDCYHVEDAVIMATALLKEYADAKVISETNIYNQRALKEKVISIQLDFINRKLGTNYTMEEVADVFKRLSFSYKIDGNGFVVNVPTYRNDIELKEDLIEEVVRLIGFDSVPFVLENVQTKQVGLTEKQKARQKIKNYLLDIGLDETLSYTLISKEDSDYFDYFSTDEAIVLPHPLTVEKEYLRRTLLKSMLNTVFYNQARGSKNVSIFEISNVYAQNKEGEKLAIAISNDFNKTLWLTNKETNYYLIKGIVEGLLSLFGIEPSRFAFESIVKHYPKQEIFHPGKAAVLKVNGQIIGVLGELHPKTIQKADIDPCVYFEMDLAKFLDLKTSKIKYAPVSKYPTISRDLAIIVEKDIAVNEILKSVKKAGGSLLASVDVFDVYMGEHVKKGYKSIALTMHFIDYTKTLVDQDVNPVFAKIYHELQKSYQAEMRS